MREGNQSESQEKFPYPFDWKSYLKRPDAVSAEVAEKLDYLANLVNNPNEAEFDDFRNHFGLYRKPLRSLVTYCRQYLSSEERVALAEAVEQADNDSATHYDKK